MVWVEVARDVSVAVRVVRVFEALHADRSMARMKVKQM
jgi:hypothetical protein